MDKIEVLGVPLYTKGLKNAVQEFLEICQTEKRESRLVSAAAAHVFIHAKENPEYAQMLKNFFWNLPDGMPSVWVGKLKGATHMGRCRGSSFFEEVLKTSANTQIKHFFCGGKEGVADELKEKCGKKFQNYNIVGTFCPPFREMTDEEMQTLAQQIQESGADVIWIGLSSPKQDIFAAILAKFVSCHFLVAVGAAFDFHTDKVKEAPLWMQNAGLEWVHRLFSEPKRLFKRYLNVVPKFIYYAIIDLLKPTPKPQN